MNSEDLPFIRQTWLRSAGSGYQGVTAEFFVPGMERRINRLLEGAQVAVAFATVAPTEILGWVCTTGEKLHFVYVKSVYRRQGVARALVEGRVKEYSHPAAKEGKQFVEALGLAYNPFGLESE